MRSCRILGIKPSKSSMIITTGIRLTKIILLVYHSTDNQQINNAIIMCIVLINILNFITCLLKGRAIYF